MTSISNDSSIPLLTEIITATDSHQEENFPDEPFPDKVDDQSLDTARGKSIEPAAMLQPTLPDDTDWERIERELRERIFQQLRLKMDVIIDERVRESLTDLLQVAVESIAGELRLGLHQVLSDVVSDAVAAELSALRKDF